MKLFCSALTKKSAINHWYKNVKQKFQTKKDFITCSKLIHLFFYKHNNYKHIEAEISEKSKHIVSIF